MKSNAWVCTVVPPQILNDDIIYVTDEKIKFKINNPDLFVWLYDGSASSGTVLFDEKRKLAALTKPPTL